jgi:large subunit ribosomal protein L21
VYAVVRIAGQQFRVHPEERVRVPLLPTEVGTEIEFGEVLAVVGETESRFGAPLVAGAKVRAEVLQHGRARKILVFHKKRRKDHRKLNGHRQPYSELRIRAIEVA